MQDDEKFMHQALALAELAGRHGEVPVGAVVVCAGEVIGRGYNLTRRLQDATAHAEMAAMRQAAAALGHWYFQDCTLYVTVEPCVMCAGTIMLARVGRLVFGAAEPKFGACGSICDIVGDKRFNHRLPVTGGLLADESARLLKDFFSRLRNSGADSLFPPGRD